MRVVWIFLAIVLAFGLWSVWPRPGQFSLEDRPALWASVKSVGLYRPRSMGENTLPPSAGDAKLRCALARA